MRIESLCALMIILIVAALFGGEYKAQKRSKEAVSKISEATVIKSAKSGKKHGWSVKMDSGYTVFIRTLQSCNGNRVQSGGSLVVTYKEWSEGIFDINPTCVS